MTTIDFYLDQSKNRKIDFYVESIHVTFASVTQTQVKNAIELGISVVEKIHKNKREQL